MSRHLCTTTHKARKQRTCWDCGWWIEPGETYQREAVVFDGRVDALCSHVECRDFACEVVEYGDDGRGPLDEWVAESGEPLTALGLPAPVLARFEARRAYCIERRTTRGDAAARGGGDE